MLCRTRDYLLAPSEWYERVGAVPNVCVPSPSHLDTLRLYYGCADTCISMADGKLAEVVDFVETHGF